MPRRQLKRFSLSDISLDISLNNPGARLFLIDKLGPYDAWIRALCAEAWHESRSDITHSGTFREYQYEAILQLMWYLWGGRYKTVADLAAENWNRDSKRALFLQRSEFIQSKEHLQRLLPLPDRLSGVVHMATGTGKSFVIFAVAYLSLVMGFTKRVLVLGPSSTTIESGLRDKFTDLLRGPTSQALRQYLPVEVRDLPSPGLYRDNQAIEDYSITIENLNAVFDTSRNSLGDTLFDHQGDILMLSDEVHHAYSHLKLSRGAVEYEDEVSEIDRPSSANKEVKWMQFIRSSPRITRHIGFTGTPYIGDDYFFDVIYNYSIKDASDEGYVKTVNPLLAVTVAGQEQERISGNERLRAIVRVHEENKQRFTYPINGAPRVKPITIFICHSQKSAQEAKGQFIDFLTDLELASSGSTDRIAVRERFSQKVEVFTSKEADAELRQKIQRVDELDSPIEYIFSVMMLNEGWDVDNVFQIVPMEERLFASRLLISQILGRGLRLPRRVDGKLLRAIKNGQGKTLNNLEYPVVSITNHVRFRAEIEEEVEAVIDSEARFRSNIVAPQSVRDRFHFTLFNHQYLPHPKVKDKDTGSQEVLPGATLILEKLDPTQRVELLYREGAVAFDTGTPAKPVSLIADEIASRFASVQYEAELLKSVIPIVTERPPVRAEIEAVIRETMEATGIEGDTLPKKNEQQIGLYFNRYLRSGTKKRDLDQMAGSLFARSTRDLQEVSVRSRAVEEHGALMLAENWTVDLNDATKLLVQILTQAARGSYQTTTRQRAGEQLAIEAVREDTSTLALLRDSETGIRLLQAKCLILTMPTQQFKTPLDCVYTAHETERDFIFELLRHKQLYSSWIKSRDTDFYSLKYTYRTANSKDVRHGSFNPDFFIVQDLEEYMTYLLANGHSQPEWLRELQVDGIKQLVRVVEIKSDDDDSNETKAKQQKGKEHFEQLSAQLKGGWMNISPELQQYAHQHYTFDLLRPKDFNWWFNALIKGEAAAS